MAELPAVSVVIPTKARPEPLRRAVDSVLGQEYDGRVQVVVVHDGEEPRSDGYPSSSHRDVVAIRNARASGAAGARNYGLEYATSPYVALCDDDDIWLPGKLSGQVQVLESDQGAIGCGGGYVLCQEGRRTTKVPGHSRLTHEDLLRSRVADVHPSTLVFRREQLLTTVGLFDEQVPGSYGEDYDLLLRATRHSYVATVPEPLAEVLWHSGSFFAGEWETISRAIRYLLDKHPDLHASREGRARLYGRLAFAQATLGRRSEAFRYATASVRAKPRQRRAYVAMLVAARALPASLAARAANMLGKGL